MFIMKNVGVNTGQRCVFASFQQEFDSQPPHARKFFFPPFYIYIYQDSKLNRLFVCLFRKHEKKIMEFKLKLYLPNDNNPITTISPNFDCRKRIICLDNLRHCLIEVQKVKNMLIVQLQLLLPRKHSRDHTKQQLEKESFTLLKSFNIKSQDVKKHYLSLQTYFRH